MQTIIRAIAYPRDVSVGPDQHCRRSGDRADDWELPRGVVACVDVLHAVRPSRDVERIGRAEVEQHRPRIVQQRVYALRAALGSEVEVGHTAAEQGMPVDHRRFGWSAALLAGDLAAVLADRLLLTSGFDAPAIARALVPYHEMRLDMAAGQVLEISGAVGGSAERPTDGPGPAATAARLKGGSYTVEGPLLVGAALAGGSDDVGRALRAFGEPLGEAFQLRDDLLDAEAPPGITTSDVNGLIERARAVLREAPIDPAAAAGLDGLASLVAMP